jgi:iron complex outermembrane recepter protein
MYYNDQLVPTGQLSNVGYSIMTNVDKSYRAGAEFTAGFRPFNFMEINTSLTLSRNKITDFVEYYTEYNTTDWSSVYASKTLGRVDIAYSPSVIWSDDLLFKVYKGIGIHLISKYVGMQYFDNTMSPDRKINSYFVNNLRLDIEPNISKIRGIEIQLLVNNLFNSMYESNAYGGNWYEDGAEKTWAYYFPQAGRNYMARLSLKF